MVFRVGLILQPSVAVIHRLDIKGTRQVDPEGEATSGYDEVLREPVAYTNTAGQRQDSRRELAAIRVPCQVENMTDEKLKEMVMGNDGVYSIMLVFHRTHLERMGLLDNNRDIILKTGDRISGLERYGTSGRFPIKKFKEPGLFIKEMRSRSWGFGPDGYDLEIAILTDRSEGFTV